MFSRLFNHLFEERTEDLFQQGCRDRLEGKLPKNQDSNYIRGYLANRARGIDDDIQYFPTVEAYLDWKRRYQNKSLK